MFSNLNRYTILILYCLSGLSIFILGIKLMASTFENIVSIKLRKNINRITSSKLLSVIIGVIMTGLIQSSSATTLIIISLVHSNLLNIYNAVPIIMGANIGTTFTSQLVAYQVEDMTPYLLFSGILLWVSLRNNKLSFLGKILFGLGLIFAGIDLISYSVALLNVSNVFTKIIYHINNNHIHGIFIGFLITAVIQSSSTGVTMLQIMASNKIIPVHTTIPIILGQNIGTCIDTLVGSLATNKIGKQTAVIHLLFNILGVTLFYFFINQLYHLVCYLTPDDPAKQIANAHTIFNVVTTIVLLPFSSFLVNIAKKIIKE